MPLLLAITMLIYKRCSRPASEVDHTLLLQSRELGDVAAAKPSVKIIPSDILILQGLSAVQRRESPGRKPYAQKEVILQMRYDGAHYQSDR
jgi:hypothetical protein